MAAIEKRGERYSVRARTPDGQQIRRTFRKKADARAFADAWETDKRQGTWVDPSRGRVLFGDYVEEWLGGMSHLRPATAEKVRGHLRVHILPTFGDMRIGTIRPDHIRGWVGALSSRGLSPSTVAGIYRTLAGIMGTAETDRAIARTPVWGSGFLGPTGGRRCGSWARRRFTAWPGPWRTGTRPSSTWRRTPGPGGASWPGSDVTE